MFKLKLVDVSEWLEQAGPLLPKHCEEVLCNKKLKIKTNILKALYELGRLFIVMMYVDGRVVGYSINTVDSEMFTSELEAVNLAIFIDKSYRKGYNGATLIVATEDVARSLGASAIIFGVKPLSRVEGLLKTKRLGYKSLENRYYKEL